MQQRLYSVVHRPDAERCSSVVHQRGPPARIPRCTSVGHQRGHQRGLPAWVTRVGNSVPTASQQRPTSVEQQRGSPAWGEHRNSVATASCQRGTPARILRCTSVGHQRRSPAWVTSVGHSVGNSVPPASQQRPTSVEQQRGSPAWGEHRNSVATASCQRRAPARIFRCTSVGHQRRSPA